MSEAQRFVKAILSRRNERASQRDNDKKGGDVEPLFDRLGAAAGLTNRPLTTAGKSQNEGRRNLRKIAFINIKTQKKRKYFILVKRFLISALEIFWPMDKVAYVSTQ